MRRGLAALGLAVCLGACRTSPRRPDLPPAVERALRALDDHVSDLHPDALIVARGPAILYERRTRAGRRPIHIRSLTKLFTATAAGLLTDEGRLRLDDPLSRFLPGWDSGLRAKETLRTLLAHASGLEQVEGDPYVAGNPDVVATVSGFTVEHAPGSVAFYDNAAYILAGAAEAKAAGEPLDAYLARKLFAPLGILPGDWSWWHDAKGTRYGHAGLVLTADGLLSFGRLWLDGGLRDGRRLLSERFVAEAASSQNKADPGFGLGWLLLGQDGRQPPWAAQWMNGTDGQLLYVHPASGVVCVQLIERRLSPAEQRPAVAGALEPCRALARALTPR